MSKVLDRRQDLVRIHVCDQALAHLVADVQQDLAVVFRIHQSPDDRALARRQRFEEVADFGGRERVDQPPHRTQSTAVERVRQQTQLARGLVVADGFGHAGVPASWEAWSRRIHEGRDRVRRSCGHYRRTRRALHTLDPQMPAIWA
jgi:hypothetical protein